MEILLSIRAQADSSTREVKVAVDHGLVVGRGAEQGILLDGPDLSREHLVITAENASLWVADLSSNGTWLNGRKLQRSAKVKVNPGDLIEIPGYALSFKLPSPPAEQPEAIERTPPPLVAEVRPFPPSAGAGRGAVLAPVLGFVASFTFLEKLLALVGIAGLGLLATYLS